MPDGDHAPLLWRMRAKLLRVAFALAVGIMLLGAFALVVGVLQGSVGNIAAGLGLLVGGALVMVRGRGGSDARGDP